MQQPSAEAVRDTLAALLQDPRYDRGLRETLWSRVAAWFGDVIQRLTQLTAQSPTAAWTIRAVLLLAATLLVARVCYLFWARRPGTLGAALARGVAGVGADPWAMAEREAAAGRYTEGAHLLYAALLRSLAAREGLRLHPAHTLGDYQRALRRSSSPAAAGFGRFARLYEVVIYGLRECDRDRYESLRTLALPLLAHRSPHAAPAMAAAAADA